MKEDCKVEFQTECPNTNGLHSWAMGRHNFLHDSVSLHIPWNIWSKVPTLPSLHQLKCFNSEKCPKMKDCIAKWLINSIPTLVSSSMTLSIQTSLKAATLIQSPVLQSTPPPLTIPMRRKFESPSSVTRGPPIVDYIRRSWGMFAPSDLSLQHTCPLHRGQL